MRRNEAPLSNWAVLIDEFNTSGQAFFESVERHLREREVPEVETGRVSFRESGVLSAKREYLRIRRDNLIFDVGASPYGTGFFFSWWLVRSRAPLAWLYTALYFIGLFLVWAVLSLGGLGGSMVGLVLTLILTTLLLGVLGRRGVLGPEEHIAQAPLVGWLYVTLFNPTTYHSLDIVAMFQESIRRAVNEAVNEALLEQGHQALSDEQKRFKTSLGVAQDAMSKAAVNS